MIVTELTWQHCRNLTGGAIAPAAGVNVICGDNAQGKTNLLELLWIYTGGRSFRGARDGELIELNRMRAASRMTFTAGGRSQTAEIALYDGRRHCTLNGVAKKNAAAMVGAFCAVVFAPVHLALVRGVQQSEVQVGPHTLQISRPRRKAFLAALADYIGGEGV